MPSPKLSPNTPIRTCAFARNAANTRDETGKLLVQIAPAPRLGWKAGKEAEKLELQVRFQRCNMREQNPEFRPYAADVIAPQQPDLLVHLLEFFHSQDVQVAEMSTQKYQSTHTGAGMVSVQMVLHVPVNQHPQALRESNPVRRC